MVGRFFNYVLFPMRHESFSWRPVLHPVRHRPARSGYCRRERTCPPRQTFLIMSRGDFPFRICSGRRSRSNRRNGADSGSCGGRRTRCECCFAGRRSISYPGGWLRCNSRSCSHPHGRLPRSTGTLTASRGVLRSAGRLRLPARSSKKRQRQKKNTLVNFLY